MKTACPICKTKCNLDSSNLYRPFCSERCRLIDLGQWFEEGYTVSEPIVFEDAISDYTRDS